jgi:diaminohydroxyphosphoribosylaminopyrimidine deaminase/5-amino-6-(5-phosphoribosylamino)uracil reductase
MNWLPELNRYEKYMNRCLQLAAQGAGYVAPNPMVGAVLVYNDRIIGEGFHQKYGGPHAEVNCINSVNDADMPLIGKSTMYVSLEPCAHFGKTPPCSDLIIQNKISKVITGCRDPFKEVNARLPARAPARLNHSGGGTDGNDAVGQGKGIEKLRAAGVEVEVGVLEKECQHLNRRFFIFNRAHRPYIILKWAETADGKIAAPLNPPGGGTLENSVKPRILISNEYSNRLVHKWRSEEASVLVGTNTALLDNPELTTRLWPGPSPVRLVVDMDLKLPSSLKLFNGHQRTIVFNSKKHDEQEDILYYQVTEDVNLVHQIINALYQLKIQSVLVEGGAKLLQSFIDESLWDEARIIKSSELRVQSGLAAPGLPMAVKTEELKLGNDRIQIFKPVN